VETVEVVVAHSERATLRVGDVFVKVDADGDRLAREVEAMALAPVPTAEVLWHRPPALALRRVAGRALGHLGDPAAGPPAAWAATGAAIRRLHDAPLPPWPGRGAEHLAERLAEECAWFEAQGVLPRSVLARNRARAEAVLRPWTPVFIHNDLQVDHVFVDGDRVTGILDWSEASPGDAILDLATVTLGYPEHLEDLLAGYGAAVDHDLVRGWWSMRCLLGVRWLAEHGYGEPSTFPEMHVLQRG
jgi:aminoglycoside phosphotransferase (APT) family kinase protein